MNSPTVAIRTEALREFPERPESEFEWEDLLLRLELMPRALRVELEHAGGGEVTGILALVNEREQAVQQLLEEVAIGPSATHHPPRQGPAAPASATSPADVGVDRFVRLRGRNFAMLQRRGIDVWDWRIQLPPEGDATVFQLLSLLARDDVETLSRLRTARSSPPGAC